MHLFLSGVFSGCNRYWAVFSDVFRKEQEFMAFVFQRIGVSVSRCFGGVGYFTGVMIDEVGRAYCLVMHIAICAVWGSV